MASNVLSCCACIKSTQTELTVLRHQLSFTFLLCYLSLSSRPIMEEEEQFENIDLNDDNICSVCKLDTETGTLSFCHICFELSMEGREKRDFVCFIVKVWDNAQQTHHPVMNVEFSIMLLWPPATGVLRVSSGGYF